jgi:hypothetical protein
MRRPVRPRRQSTLNRGDESAMSRREVWRVGMVLDCVVTYIGNNGYPWVLQDAWRSGLNKGRFVGRRTQQRTAGE